MAGRGQLLCCPPPCRCRVGGRGRGSVCLQLELLHLTLATLWEEKPCGAAHHFQPRNALNSQNDHTLSLFFLVPIVHSLSAGGLNLNLLKKKASTVLTESSSHLIRDFPQNLNQTTCLHLLASEVKLKHQRFRKGVTQRLIHPRSENSPKRQLSSCTCKYVTKWASNCCMSFSKHPASKARNTHTKRKHKKLTSLCGKVQAVQQSITQYFLSRLSLSQQGNKNEQQMRNESTRKKQKMRVPEKQIAKQRRRGE